MRITKKSSSNIYNMVQVISHINQNQKKLSSLDNQFESGNKNQKKIKILRFRKRIINKRRTDQIPI